MYTPSFFSIEELVPPSIYERRGERAWQLLDERMLVTIDQLRMRFGPMAINTWHSEKLQKAYGLRTQSGLRTLEFYQTYYGDKGLEKYLGSLSQHKYGRAFDCLFEDYPDTDVVRSLVRQDRTQFPHLAAMETDISWFHGDVRNCQPIMEFPG